MTRSLVFDSSPLIYLTRAGLIPLIQRLPSPKFAARSVYDEVVERGKSKGHADALALSGLFEASVIRILDPKRVKLLQTFLNVRGLGVADAETLVIAKEREYTAVIDDLTARKVATTYGIKFVGTPHILLLGVQHGLLTRIQATQAIDDMIAIGWRCGPELYRKISQLIKTA